MLWKKKKKTDEVTEEDTRSLDPLDASEEIDDPLDENFEGQSETEDSRSEDSQADPSQDIDSEADEFGELEEQETEFQLVKAEIHRQVIGSMDLSLIGTMEEGELRFEIRRAAEQILEDRSHLLNLQEQERLIEEIIDETFGLGPLEPLFRDGSITDILINGPKMVYVERKGRLSLSKIKFANDEHLLKIIQRIVSGVGRRVDETCPMVDARLPDGSRVNAIIPPLALDGALVSIRRFGASPLKAKDLLANDSITKEMLKFISACVRGRMNVLISGGTGSGKTTLLNVLSGYIPSDERIATIEDAAELQLQQPHVIRMETRPPNIEGSGEITTRDLVKNCLRMRPDRILVGECRGPEALDMLQAMNTGHDGSLTTVHANTARDAISRLEMMVGMCGFDIPVWTIRRQIASAINIVVQTVRLTGGLRKIVGISEITGMEGEVLTMHDLFLFHQTGVDESCIAQGYFTSTGVRPNCLERLASAGISLPNEMFSERVLATEGDKA
ncbi:MAG: pilus assembly protein CpaF [Blastopirellula sp.]|nr:MAG: pilus assembly protein CpaF [Blastopirellula sp.]